MSTEIIDDRIAKPADKAPTKKPAEVAKPDYGKTIAVKVLTFHQPHPNLDARNSISAETAPGKGKVSIEFVPALRHHRVEIQRPGVDAVRVLFIYEGHVASFEPL